MRKTSKTGRLTRWLAVFGCVLACAAPRVLAGETPPNVAGAWEVTTRAAGKVVNERWTIQQRSATITGTATGAHGDVPFSGTIAGVSFRVTVRDGDAAYKVRATVDGDAMDGSVTRGEGDESPWHARRAKTR